MSFADQLSRIAENVKTTEDKLLRSIIIEMGNSVIKLSPVDTGRFRGNWQHSSGSPATGQLLVNDKQGTATQSKIAASVADVQAGGVEYLTNNLPYAQQLEFGSSKQAPGGMVRVTAARFRRIVEEKAR